MKKQYIVTIDNVSNIIYADSVVLVKDTNIENTLKEYAAERLQFGQNMRVLDSDLRADFRLWRRGRKVSYQQLSEFLCKNNGVLMMRRKHKDCSRFMEWTGVSLI